MRKFSALLIVIGTIICFVVFKDKIYRLKGNDGSYYCKNCNVILISMTNLRYDHASFDGYNRRTTTNLDVLAKESLVFDNAFSHASWTLPESISIYTGLYPYQHGVMGRRDGSKLSKNTPTLIDFFNNNGYKTAAFTGGFDYNPEFGATSRFQTYQECASGQNDSYPRQPGPRLGTAGSDLYGELKCTVPKAIDWLKQNSATKFFLQVQGFDAHCPFNPSAKNIYDPNYKGQIDFTNCFWTFDKTNPKLVNGELLYPVQTSVNGVSKEILLNDSDIKHLVSLYDASVASADGYIGELLDEVKSLGLTDKTIIIFTSEHGDMLGKYGRFMRGGPAKGTFYDDVLHIPLLIKLPNIFGKRIDGLTAQIDLMPTILDLLGIRNTAKVEGKSLRPLIFNNTKINNYVFAGSTFNPSAENIDLSGKSSVDAIRSGDWKLIRETIFDDTSPDLTRPVVRKELYELKSDSQELNNVAGSNQTILKYMEDKLNKWEALVKPK